MLVLLPPSETKRAGGRRAPLDLDRLALPALHPQRVAVVAALRVLSADADEAIRALRLTSGQRGEVEVNTRLQRSPTLPAVDRYTGVLYNALDAASLGPSGRRWLGRHVLVHTAPLGPVGALDPIPDHRLVAVATLPGLPPMPRVWATAVSAALAERPSPFVVDLRSEAYVRLGPIPATTPSVYVRVVRTGEDGTTRALNHVNKAAKGALVRTLAEQRPSIRSLRGLLRWSDSVGISLSGADDGEVLLHA